METQIKQGFLFVRVMTGEITDSPSGTRKTVLHFVFQKAEKLLKADYE